jgi:hypothetical protein
MNARNAKADLSGKQILTARSKKHSIASCDYRLTDVRAATDDSWTPRFCPQRRRRLSHNDGCLAPPAFSNVAR